LRPATRKQPFIYSLAGKFLRLWQRFGGRVKEVRKSSLQTLISFAFNDWACWLDRSRPGLVLGELKMLPPEKGEAPKPTMSTRQGTDVVSEVKRKESKEKRND
jgi:hypothetical protein